MLRYMLILGYLTAAATHAAGADAPTGQEALASAMAKLTEHTIRLEEQNKATQQQLALLERQMEKRFEAMDKRFEAMDKRLEAFQHNMDKRFEGVDKRFEGVDKRLDMLQQNMDRRLDALDKRIDVVTWVFGAMGSAIGFGVVYLICVAKGVVVLQEEIKQKVDAERVMALEGRVEAMAQDVERDQGQIIRP